MRSASTPSPVPLAIARSMLSLGIEASRAFWMARASAGLPSGSPPPSRAATVIARASLVNSCPRRASTTAFLCLIECHLECPDMCLQSSCRLADRTRRPGAGRSSPQLGMGAVPLDRPPQALLQTHPRPPAGQLPQPGAVDPLAVDLPVGHAAAADLRP